MDAGLARVAECVVEPQIPVTARIVVDQIRSAAIAGRRHVRNLIVGAALFDGDSRARIAVRSRTRKMIEVAALVAGALSFFVASDEQSDLPVAIY